MTKKAEIIDSITPKQFGISSISDALWHGPQEQGIDNRAHFLEKMGNFSTDLEDVQETLSWLDIMEFPYDSSQAKSGVLSGFSVIHLRVNEDVESYKRVVGLNLGQIASLPHSFYRALTTYPLGIHHEGEIQPGDAGDFTKSRVLTLLAERGMYYTLTDRLLNTALINNQLAAVEMPYERIFNYINWAFDEFSCIQFGRELNAYIGKNGIDGDYRSSIHEIDSFVQSLGAMLYLLKDASVRNEGHEPGEITSGQHDITISVLENILSENISNWERLQRYHKNKLVRIATGFIVSAFPVGHACEVTRFSTQKLYAADLNRRNETGEPNTSKESGFEANQSSSKKCHYSLTR